LKRKKSFGDIVIAQKGIKNNLFSKQFATIFCCTQLIEILTNSCQHVTERNARFSADDVIETKKDIGDIVLAQKSVNSGFLSEVFASIFCCTQHIEILTNSVST